MKYSVVAAALVGAACSSGASSFTCPKGQVPCGDGCIPGSGVCCEGHFAGATGSSYCTNTAGGGCFGNPNSAAQTCAAAFPSGVNARYCCSANSSIGSNDCPAGQHHCGLNCQPSGTPCCPSGSSSADCPSAADDCSRGGVSCGSCNGLCYSCDPGECCNGDVCAQGYCTAPKAGSACTGVPVTGSGGGGGSCAVTFQQCCPSGAGNGDCCPPPNCACPSGTSDRGICTSGGCLNACTSGNRLCAC